MLFDGKIMGLITDLNILGSSINDIDHLTVAAVTDNYPNHCNIHDATILMPPTELLMAWADGNQLVLYNQYPWYLAQNQMANDMIVALLAALTKKNVYLYIPVDEFPIFGNQLLQHIYANFGVTVATPWGGRFYFDQSRLPLLLNNFYMIDVMSANDLLQSYPANCEFPNQVINKLASEIRPFGHNQATFDQYAQYFNNIVKNRLQQVQMVNIKGE